ncbi:thioredoxin-like domain-containing protein [Acidobacteriota bacterium]
MRLLSSLCISRCVAAPLLLWIVACSPAKQEVTKDAETVRVQGVLLTDNSRALELAHVHIYEMAARKAVQPAAVAADGTFRFDADVGVPLLIELSGVNHRMCAVPAVFDGSKDTARLEVTLAPHAWADSFDEVKIFGDWNGFDWEQAEAMKRRKDGTFVWEGRALGEKVKYQLLNVAPQYTVNGTMSEAYEYDGDSDYRSVVTAKDGKVRIVFDPKALPTYDGVDLPRVNWDNGHDYLNKAFKLRQARSEAWRIYHEQAGGDDVPAKIRAISDTFMPYLVEGQHHPILRKMAAYWTASLPLYDDDVLEQKVYKQVLDILPPGSSIWRLEPQWIIKTIDRSGVNKEALYQQFVKDNPDRLVRGRILAEFMVYCYRSGEEDRWKRLYKTLSSEYGDLEEIRFYFVEYNPDRTIEAGKSMPDFTFTLVDGTDLTNSDLKGKTYLLHAWATWCEPSVDEIPSLHKAYEKYRRRNFEIVSLSLDKSFRQVKAFQKEKWKMPWKHVFLRDASKEVLAEKLEMAGLPKSVLVGPDGTILLVDPTGQALLDALAEHLQ